jgi:mercuric ion transport protein
MRAARVFAGSILAAVLASLCCIGPLLVAVTGLGSMSLFGRFEVARPYLLGISAALLVAGIIWSVHSRRTQCGPGTACKPHSVAYWAWLAMPVLVVAAAAAFPNYSSDWLAVARKNSASSVQPANQMTKVQFRITGMTCEACASGLAASFRNLAGVQAATVEYPSGNATVTYAPDQISVEQLTALVQDAGYQFHR